MTLFQKILIGVVIIMIVINGLLLTWIWGFRSHRLERPHRFKHRTEHFLQEKLDLNNDQKLLFRDLQEDHLERMSNYNRDIRLLNREMHKSILEGDVQTEMEISQQIDSLHFLIKQESSDHIRNLSKLLDEQQKSKFLEELNKLPDRYGHRGDGPHRRKRRKERSER